MLQDLPIPLSREYDGFECAIWDASAKSLGVPLHKLLGGAVRDRVKVGAWSSFREAGEMGALAAKFRDEGYDCIKLKAGLDDDVVGWCTEIKADAPGMWVIIDPNQRWENAGEARRRLRELDAIGNLLLIEDPIPRWMLQDYARLRSFTATPVVLHVSLPYVYLGQRPYEAISQSPTARSTGSTSIAAWPSSASSMRSRTAPTCPAGMARRSTSASSRRCTCIPPRPRRAARGRPTFSAA